MRKTAAFTRILKILLFLAIVSVGIYLFFLASLEPLKVRSLVVDGSEFTAGGPFSFTIDFCKTINSTVPGEAKRYIYPVDENGNPTKKEPYILSDREPDSPKGCNVITREINLPFHIPADCYRLKLVTSFYPGILREPIRVETNSKNTFCVKQAETQAIIQDILRKISLIQGQEAPKVNASRVPQVTPEQGPKIVEAPKTTEKPTPPPAPRPQCVVTTDVLGVTTRVLCN